MCFSASASFTASALLLLAGVATLSKTLNNGQRLLAAIPLLFGMQQAAEGLVWLSFTHPAFVLFRLAAAYLFLFFAGVVWPIWIPLSIRAWEKHDEPRYLQTVSLLSGIAVAAMTAVHVMRYGIDVGMSRHHIYYDLRMSFSLASGLITLYLLATVAPFFTVSRQRMWIVGALLGLAYLVSYIFYYNELVSVWCFFAAILSILVYMVVSQDGALIRNEMTSKRT